MSNQQKLQQPITNGSLRVTNFFNGRLVTSADMTREQIARREAVSRLGLATGDGIVEGLRVEKSATAGSEPVVNIGAGLAVNRCGQVLYLSNDTTVNLLNRLGITEQASNIFATCQPLQVGTYTAGFGLYLLVLSPAETREGSAPTSGLRNAFATCNTDVILEAVQFRLLPIDPFLANEVLPNNRLRNYIAYRCFGTAETQGFYQNPLGFSRSAYGLMDEMRDKTLSKSDVPLAIINWTSNGLNFVEMWAVRRRLTTRNDANDWTQLGSDRRLSETEAIIQQFADHIKDAQPEINDFREVEAVDFFYYLPPVGMLPLATSTAKVGFNLENFFGDRRLDDVAMLDGEQLQPLMREALMHEPVNLNSDEKIQVYFIKENFLAAQAKQVKQITVVFAKRSLPYYGTARFDLADWNFSRFV